MDRPLKPKSGTVSQVLLQLVVAEIKVPNRVINAVIPTQFCATPVIPMIVFVNPESLPHFALKFRVPAFK